MESEIGIFSQHWVNGQDRGTRLGHFDAFEPSFTGGASVATGDVDGDGTPEIVAASGPGRVGEVRVFDWTGHQLLSFLPFGSDYTGGLSVAAGDLNADGRAEIVVGTLAPPARVRAFSGKDAFGPVIQPFAPGSPGVEVGVADVTGTGRGLIVAGSASGAKQRLALVDPLTGNVVRSVDIDDSLPNGIRVAGGDVDADGKDEIVVAPGFGGDSRVRIFDGNLNEEHSFGVYDWYGAGMNVAVATRIGLPIVSQARTVKMTAGKRARIIVARFTDAAGEAGRTGLRAEIDWGDGTDWIGTLVPRGNGIYDVRSTKRFSSRGRYQVTVTLTNDRGRTSIAHSTAVVARKKR
jgi:hypothetical protein